MGWALDQALPPRLGGVFPRLLASWPRRGLARWGVAGGEQEKERGERLCEEARRLWRREGYGEGGHLASVAHAPHAQLSQLFICEAGERLRVNPLVPEGRYAAPQVEIGQPPGHGCVGHPRHLAAPPVCSPPSLVDETLVENLKSWCESRLLHHNLKGSDPSTLYGLFFAEWGCSSQPPTMPRQSACEALGRPPCLHQCTLEHQIEGGGLRATLVDEVRAHRLYRS